MSKRKTGRKPSPRFTTALSVKYRTEFRWSRVVVKFHDSVVLPYVDGVERHFKKHLAGPWLQLKKEFPRVAFKRLFTALAPTRIRALLNRAIALDNSYEAPNMLTYFAVRCPPSIEPKDLIDALKAWPIVQTAFLEGQPGPPPSVSPDDDLRWPSQGYLDPAPIGIDAEFAWGAVDPGGAGEGIQIVDLEQGWNLKHKDLVAAGITLISGINKSWFNHGTSILGIILAVDNSFGNIGIASRGSGRVISEWRSGRVFSTADAILGAVATLNAGDVLLLETQFWPDRGRPLPREVQADVFDNIRLATALGIVVVEAAGNGAIDLDAYADASGRQVLNRNSADFMDSGAIIVGASSSSVPHERHSFSNYGSRIDCYGWGENISTLTTNARGNANNRYTDKFGGTSGASAIIAGATLIVQSAAQETLGHRYRPPQIRAMLSDPTTGTPSQDPNKDRIGVMPNLRNILEEQKPSSTP